MFFIKDFKIRFFGGRKMKKSTIKIVAFVIIMLMLFGSMVMPVKASTEYESIILKTGEGEYIVYYGDVCEEEFQFAVADSATTDPSTLSYTGSVKDKLEDGALNVAYVDSTNNPANATKVYMWILDNSDNEVVSAYEIDLSEALTDSIIELVNTTTIANADTERIKVDTTKTQTENKTVDGVDTIITTGKIVVTEKENAKYSYTLIQVEDGSDAKNLSDLVTDINNYSGNTYGKLELVKDFYDNYTKLMPKDAEWTNIENGEILQPEDAKEGDLYIAYIKEKASDGKEVIDVKILECIREEKQGKDEKEETITEVVSSPVTYDSITLLVIFGVILILIVMVVVLKRRENKKSEE